VFLVTGSTDGIGRHTAARLKKAGATVLLHGRYVPLLCARENVRGTCGWFANENSPERCAALSMYCARGIRAATCPVQLLSAGCAPCEAWQSGL
jgi:NAD(P)-dependent dehydrogenase (short-subunit alcohol dehydrogenase family)